MAEIITDQSALRQVSKPASITKTGKLSKPAKDVLQELLVSIPENGAGLAAPQIGEFQRIFIAKLSDGFFAFVNPSLFDASDQKSPSTEGCLSIPGLQWCVSRHQSITIQAELVFMINNDNELSDPLVNFPKKVYGLDSFIVQHEYDHLEGVLMIDHHEVESREEMLKKMYQQRQMRIDSNRQAKQMWGQIKEKKRTSKVNPKRAAKIKKMEKAARRREKRRIEIQEKLIAEQEGLFDSPSSDTH